MKKRSGDLHQHDADDDDDDEGTLSRKDTEYVLRDEHNPDSFLSHWKEMDL